MALLWHIILPSKDSITLEFTEFVTEFLLHMYLCEQNEWNVSYATSISHSLDIAILHRSKDLERRISSFCSVAVGAVSYWGGGSNLPPPKF